MMHTPPVSILIVEDEMIIAARISMYLTNLGYGVAGILPAAEDVVPFLKENRPDIILLDIQLKGEMNGIELANNIRADFQIPVVFLTANSDDATFAEAKKAKPYAFLNKPFKQRELARAIELTISLLAEESGEQDETAPEKLTDRIFVFAGERRVKVMLEDILFIQAERNYCRIYTEEKEQLLSMPMKKLEPSLPSELFHRIHRSYIVNVKQVDEVGETGVGIGNHRLAMSSTYRKGFLERIQSI